MSTASGGLSRLHALHLELQETQDQLDRGPKRVAACHTLTERKRDEAGTLEEELMRLRMSADEKALQLKSNEAKIADLKAKLNAATTNREFSVIRSQIDADEMANSVLEDEILEALDKVDSKQAAISEKETERDAAAERETTVAAEVAEAKPGLDQRAGELREKLAVAERDLPPSIMPDYRRLVQAHGAGALAQVENKACTACFAILTPQTLVELNMGKHLQCRSCGRLLYQ